MSVFPEVKRWKEYIDSKLKRSYGKTLVYEDTKDEVVFVGKDIRFYVADENDVVHYNLTLLDIVYLIRYVRFLSILVSLLIFLVLVLLIFWS